MVRGRACIAAAARVLAAVLPLLLPTESLSTAPPVGRIGVYADANHSVSEVWSTGGTCEFTMYVFCQPGINGMTCAKYKISYPDNVTQGIVAENPAITFSEGELAHGIDVCFGECRTDWVWSHSQVLFLTDSIPSEIEIVPPNGIYHFTTCEDGNPMETVFTNGPLCLNHSCAPDTDPPVITFAAAIDADRVRIDFNEPLDAVTANATVNYEVFETIDPSNVVPVQAAALEPGAESVVLSLESELTAWVVYTVRVSNVEDIAGNAIAPNSEETFVLTSTSSAGQIGLYLDENRSDNCAGGSGFYELEMWIWCKPGDLGQMCAEFAIDYPENVVQSLVTENENVVAVKLGTLESGMSVCYRHCQLGWNWPFHQTIFVADSLPTTVRIVEHPDVGRFQFANCSPGYPIEDVERCSSIMINCGQHTLTLVDAVAHDQQHVGIGFSKPVNRSTAENEANYSIFVSGDSTSTIPVVDAHLESGEMDVLLTLGGNLVHGIHYTARASNVEDQDGNAIAPGSGIEFSFCDTHPPHLVHVTVENDTTLGVVFSETMDSVTATETSNYSLSELEHPAAAVEITSAALSPDSMSVLLSLADTLSNARNYVLRVSNVLDTAGNPIVPGSEFVIYETDPPSLAGVAVADPMHVDVTFDEPVDRLSAQAKGNYKLYVTGSATETIAITAAVLAPGDVTVRLTLGDSLVAYTSYTVEVSNVEDLVGNEIAPASSIGFEAPDLVPPVLLDAVVRSPVEVEVAFSETVDSTTAGDASNYELNELFDPFVSVDVTGAERGGNGTIVVLSLGDPLSAERSYRLNVSNVEDTVGNAIAPGSGTVIYETVAPGIVEVTVISVNSLQVRFSETLDEETAEIAGNYLLHRTGDSTATVPVGESILLLGGDKVLLKLDTQLQIQVSYTLEVSDVADLAGNTVPPGSGIDFMVYDTTPPELAAAEADNATTVVVTFSEPVDSASAVQVSNYTIFRTGNPSDTKAISQATLKVGNTRVALSLADPLPPGIRHTVQVSNVEDPAGNPVPLNSMMSFTYSAEWTGSYIGLYVDENHGFNHINPQVFVPFDVYVWCSPGIRDMMCAEFAIVLPAPVMPLGLITNPIIAVQLGDPVSGISSCFGSCQSGWVWTHRLQCMLVDVAQGTIRIVPHPDVGACQFANCLPGYPLENATVCSNIYINQEAPGVLLESYSAVYDHGGIELVWRLAGENEGISFVVMRAEGSGDDFREISSDKMTGDGRTFTFRDGDVEPGESYRYRVACETGGDRHLLFESDPVNVPSLQLTLHQNRPNPFNPATTIGYCLPACGRVSIEIFGVTGDKVVTLVDEFQTTGDHSVEWNGFDESGRAAASGVYFCRLRFEKNVLSRKMILLR